MSSASGAVAGSVPRGKNEKALEAARAARKANAGSNAELSDVQRFVLNNILQAGKACKLLSKAARDGKTIDPSIVKACGDLAAAAADALAKA
jgi:hypothetical protein